MKKFEFWLKIHWSLSGPPGFNPLPPPNFFPPYPRPLIHLFFFGYPRPKFRILAPPLTPRPFFVKFFVMVSHLFGDKPSPEQVVNYGRGTRSTVWTKIIIFVLENAFETSFRPPCVNILEGERRCCQMRVFILKISLKCIPCMGSIWRYIITCSASGSILIPTMRQDIIWAQVNKDVCNMNVSKS